MRIPAVRSPKNSPAAVVVVGAAVVAALPADYVNTGAEAGFAVVVVVLSETAVHFA